MIARGEPQPEPAGIRRVSPMESIGVLQIRSVLDGTKPEYTTFELRLGLKCKFIIGHYTREILDDRSFACGALGI